MEKNKIFIVGHEYSNYEKVENLLNLSGLEKVNTLKKEQIDTNEKWETVDPESFFIFVYDAPENLLKKLLQEEQNIASDMLEEELKDWLRYNKALLEFHNHNKDRSLLVNSEQIVLNSQAFLDQVSNKAGMPELKSDALTAYENNVLLSSDDLLYEHLLAKVLEEQPEVLALFEALQEVADPSLKQNVKEKLTAMETLQKYNEYRNKNNVKINHLEKKNEELLQNRKEQTELVNIYQNKESQLKKWLECKVVEEDRLEKYIDVLDQKFIKEISDLQKNLEKSNMKKEKDSQKYKKITEKYDLVCNKEQQLKKWVECKSTEIERLEKYIDTLKEEKP